MKFIFIPEEHPGAGLDDTIPCSDGTDMIWLGEPAELII
jgi:hypothetical protein